MGIVMHFIWFLLDILELKLYNMQHNLLSFGGVNFVSLLKKY